MKPNEPLGILLINTGTTDAPRAPETRAYLREFLSDPRVLDIPAVKRSFILNCFILPFRPAKSAEAYEAIWTEAGSPLLVISHAFRDRVNERFPHADVRVAMRYGKPSIPQEFQSLVDAGVKRIIVAPLFPHYASASTGSVLELVYRCAANQWNVPALSALPDFFDNPGFLDAWLAVSRPYLDEFNPDFVLFSYHGLPERQVRKSDRSSGRHCLTRPGCCDAIVDANRYCYRAQCMATTRELVARLRLNEGGYMTTFQSRLGRDPWITPATDIEIPKIARQGYKRMAVFCPAFVADCLETLEEIGIRAKEDFIAAGGEDLRLIPSLNDHPAWVDAFAMLIEPL
jgi:protoporphyrin/coproporphyrin ferrochelatase